MIRPSATATASLAKYGTVDHPRMGDVRVGVGDAANPRWVAMARLRSSWKGSVTMSTFTASNWCSCGAASARFSHESRPPDSSTSSAGTPCPSR